MKARHQPIREPDPVPALQVEGASYQTSILYWVGVLEQVANVEFAKALGEPRTIVGRWRTLSVLAERNGMPITQLANTTFIERTALSRVLDSLEAEGLLYRQPRPDDRRTVEVYITPRGRRSFKRMLPVRRAVLKQATDGFSQEDLADLMGKLQTMVANLNADTALGTSSVGKRTRA